MTRVQVAKWGNSSAIRLPKAILDELGLRPGQGVELSVNDWKGIIEPEETEKINMEWKDSETIRLGSENAPETVDWGPDLDEEAIEDDYAGGELTLGDSLKGR
jgi:antitoxin MazE